MKTFIVIFLISNIIKYTFAQGAFTPQKNEIKIGDNGDWGKDNCGTSVWNVIRVWVTCDEYTENCYLETPYMDIGNANRIHIEVQTETKTCQGRSKPPPCQNNLTMEIQKAKSAAEPKKWTNYYEVPGKVNTSVERFKYTDKIVLDEMSEYDGIRIRFQTIYFCGNIAKIYAYYFECPTATGDLVVFPASPAPDFKTKTIRINGNCTANAVPTNPLKTAFMNCNYRGEYQPFGSCICDEGYTKAVTSCEACEPGTYKRNVGNDGCLKCGENVKDGAPPRTLCDCLDGYFRADGVSANEADCYAPPEMTKSTIDNIKAHEATISWSTPEAGSGPLGVWILTCSNCPGYITAFPIRTNETSVILKNLGAFTTYNLKLRNENNITKLIDSKNINVETIKPFVTQQGAPGPIECKYITNPDGSVTFTWDAPFSSGGKNPQYIVKYGDKELRMTERTFTIETALQEKQYTVKIKVEVTANSIVMTGPECINTITVNGGIPLPLALGIAFGCVIFIVIALVAAFCIWKRRNPAYLQVVRMEDGSVKLPARFYTGGKIYVDPKSYPDVDEAVNEFAFEIDRHDLKLLEKIGEGEFADVYKGELNRGAKQAIVAVKILKPGSTRMDRDDFLSEAAIVGQFSDPNVIMLEGVILKDEPNAIILEYMEHGSLDTFLQENDMQFTVLELLEMARGIASGMKYLSEMGFIHRDLAARNILVNKEKICKIADFGMSLEIKMEDGAEAKGGKIPVRWTAPEAIQFKKFTTASDVWSYGIVLWEVMSYGERPYWEWTNYEVLEQVTRGYRLPPPMGCPRVVHDLMLHCWNKERTKRPLFSIIRERIDAWLNDPELLEEVAVLMKLDTNLDYTIMQTINKWLQAIGMGRYATNFIEQGFATPRQILLLTIDDLEELGIGNIEHQKRIHKAIENTRSQVEAQMSRSGSIVSNKNAKDDFTPHDI